MQLLDGQRVFVFLLVSPILKNRASGDNPGKAPLIVALHHTTSPTYISLAVELRAFTADLRKVCGNKGETEPPELSSMLMRVA